jgi:phasin family protein
LFQAGPIRLPGTRADFCRSAAKALDAVQHDRYIGVIANDSIPEIAMTTRTKTPAGEKALDVTNVVQDATAKVETFVADTQKAVTEQFEKLSKGLEGLTTFGQENVDALVKSSEIAAKAAEGIGTEISAYSKKSFEDGVAAAQDFASAKTLTELFEKQTSYAQTAFEGFVSQATKMNEIYVAAAKDISAPIGARVNAATEALKTFSL